MVRLLRKAWQSIESVSKALEIMVAEWPGSLLDYHLHHHASWASGQHLLWQTSCIWRGDAGRVLRLHWEVLGRLPTTCMPGKWWQTWLQAEMHSSCSPWRWCSHLTSGQDRVKEGGLHQLVLRQVAKHRPGWPGLASREYCRKSWQARTWQGGSTASLLQAGETLSGWVSTMGWPTPLPDNPAVFAWQAMLLRHAIMGRDPGTWAQLSWQWKSGLETHLAWQWRFSQQWEVWIVSSDQQQVLLMCIFWPSGYVVCLASSGNLGWRSWKGGNCPQGWWPWLDWS